MRFLSTLAGQAALAAANARLYRTAEVGGSAWSYPGFHPDPVLVTDQENRLILTNPAAKRALAGWPARKGSLLNVSSASRSCATC